MGSTVSLILGWNARLSGLPYAAETSPSTDGAPPGTRLLRTAGSNPASSARWSAARAGTRTGTRTEQCGWSLLTGSVHQPKEGMGRKVAVLWHASFSIGAGALLLLFVLPCWSLMGDTDTSLGTGPIATGKRWSVWPHCRWYSLCCAPASRSYTLQLALSMRIRRSWLTCWPAR